MSNSVFQSVMVQLKDATDRVFGVIDTDVFGLFFAEKQAKTF